MIVLAVVWQANEGHEEEVAGIFRKLEAATRTEPGCLMYVVHRHVSDKRRFFLYEQYKDQAAVDAHRNAPHFQQYAVQQLRDVAKRLEGEFYNPLT